MPSEFDSSPFRPLKNTMISFLAMSWFILLFSVQLNASAGFTKWWRVTKENEVCWLKPSRTLSKGVTLFVTYFSYPLHLIHHHLFFDQLYLCFSSVPRSFLLAPANKPNNQIEKKSAEMKALTSFCQQKKMMSLPLTWSSVCARRNVLCGSVCPQELIL